MYSPQRQLNEKISHIILLCASIFLIQCGETNPNFHETDQSESELRSQQALSTPSLPQVIIRTPGGLKAAQGFAPAQLISETETSITVVDYIKGVRDTVDKESGIHWSNKAINIANITDCPHDDEEPQNSVDFTIKNVEKIKTSLLADEQVVLRYVRAEKRADAVVESMTKKLFEIVRAA